MHPILDLDVPATSARMRSYAFREGASSNLIISLEYAKDCPPSGRHCFSTPR